MELTLRRTERTDRYTAGRLYGPGGSPLCDTLEDRDRGLLQGQTLQAIAAVKVKGRTAIPAGRYRVRTDVISPRFRRRPWARPYGGRVPRLCGVPGFGGVLIHPGNTPADTSGCILTGRRDGEGRLADSADAFRRLMDTLEALPPGEQVWLTVE